ncbi:hypothetical protein GO613_14645 [Azoarcus communis]|uniref:Uncharacterized protein n=1 Tax=Parazoarcus communis SWub3 = DSM 12120 TaxID=1121029 RepID=A0A323UXY4_9RHOO|nr:hypothetical protein [Parazoarcus communis]NMG49333.1 hypothetical protein [Parazoarcus communis]NMG69411.1 hypothetical protein [Parazoarcus communis SWub3 = DSM 12120]PZA17357.1 hypothetical protein DNK49_05705 [Azoarcus communis] [Parazoarcus communis SWub3 = DSM 12120]
MSQAPLAPPAPRTTPTSLDDTLRALCATVTPLPGHALLLDALRRQGGPEFTPRLSRGGWFRPGRILDADGNTVADSALEWLEQAWADCGEDGASFTDEYAEAGLVITLEQGVSHYLVAPASRAPDDYLQLEIEELQEVISHAVGGRGPAIDSVEALLDRPADAPPPQPLAAPRYRFRRLTDMRGFISRLDLQAGSPPPVLRFLRDWASSSAGQQRNFCDHWVLALSEHLDRFRQPRAGAVPVAAHAPQWHGTPGLRGTPLAQQLHDYDRAAGYGFAWYFHMISAHRVPRNVAPDVFADLQDDMAYLPERDAALIHAWMREPYSI